MRAQRARNPLVLYMIPPRLGARPAWPRRPKFYVRFDLNLKAASSPPSSAVWSPPSFTLPVPFHTVPCQSLLRRAPFYSSLPTRQWSARGHLSHLAASRTFPSLSLSSSTASFTLLPPQLPAPPPSSSLAPPPLLSLSPPRAELQRRGRTGCSAQLGSGGARGRPRHPPGHGAARPSSLSPRRAAGPRELGSIPPHRALAGHGGKAVPPPRHPSPWWPRRASRPEPHKNQPRGRCLTRSAPSLSDPPTVARVLLLRRPPDPLHPSRRPAEAVARSRKAEAADPPLCCVRHILRPPVWSGKGFRHYHGPENLDKYLP